MAVGRTIGDAVRRAPAWAAASARPYLQAMPAILLLQLATTAILMTSLFLFQLVARQLSAMAGAVAQAAGDLGSAIRTAGAWLLLAAMLLVILSALATDLCAKAAFAGQMVGGERLSIRRAFRQAFAALPRFRTPAGLAVIAYVAAVAPALGVGLTLPFAEKLKLPAFAHTLVDTKTLAVALYAFAVAAFALLGFLGVFTFQGVVLERVTPKEAFARSRRYLRGHRLNFLANTARFTIWNLLLTLPVWLATFGVPVALAFREGLGSARESGGFLAASRKPCRGGRLGAARFFHLTFYVDQTHPAV